MHFHQHNRSDEWGFQVEWPWLCKTTPSMQPPLCLRFHRHLKDKNPIALNWIRIGIFSWVSQGLLSG